MLEPISPTETKRGDGDREFEHPAFAMVGASRVQGQATLYGSDFIHHNFIILRIVRSSYRRGLSHDWHHGEKELIEVSLSEAQWATMISSLNVGEGVPCTLERLQGAEMPGIALDRSEVDDFSQEVKEHAGKAATLVNEAICEVEGLAAGLSKKKRDAMLAPLIRLRMELGANVPYVVDCFGKHIEDRLEKAKIEVNAYVQSAIMRAGVATLDSVPPVSLPLLPSKEEA